MKTIAQALKDELTYPVNHGLMENKLMARGLDPDVPVSGELLNSASFVGAKADCLFSLVDAVNFSESDISISLPDRDVILKMANYLYRSIGEEEKILDKQPTVWVGPPPGTYVGY